jgi:threonine/homoserine/homoserine lactone efflux protein
MLVRFEAMPTGSTIALFCAAALALIVVPGPAVTYIVTQSIDKGRKAGLVSAVGVALGGLVHVAAATAGLSALLASSASAFTVVKLTGAAYLIALGIWRLAGRSRGDAADDVQPVPVQSRRLLLHGLVVNILNPKTALFFLAFLPQFIERGHGPFALQAGLLGSIFVAIAVVSDSTYALTASALAGRLRASARARRIQRYVSGGVFVGLGVTAAAARRASA